MRRRVSLRDTVPLQLVRRRERIGAPRRPGNRDPRERAEPHRAGGGVRLLLCPRGARVRELGFKTIMINSNPETVSTDFDISDKLYFEPLTFEDVLEIVRWERPKGVVVQLGGQTPLRLTKPLEAACVPILGTAPDSIDT